MSKVTHTNTHEEEKRNMRQWHGVGRGFLCPLPPCLSPRHKYIKLNKSRIFFSDFFFYISREPPTCHVNSQLFYSLENGWQGVLFLSLSLWIYMGNVELFSHPIDFCWEWVCLDVWIWTMDEAGLYWVYMEHKEEKGKGRD